MRTRALDSDGDYQFGRRGQWLVDSAEAVAQTVRTRLALWTGEWFLDVGAGTDYAGEVLGTGTQGSRDVEIKQRVLTTPGVTEIVQYSSTMNGRSFVVSMRLQTAYGITSTITLST